MPWLLSVRSEFERIRWLKHELGGTSEGFLGVGDDAAVLPPSGRAGVWTVDAAVEGVHFKRHMLSFLDLGYRSFMAAASDVAAMGATPRAALLSLVLPKDVSEDDFQHMVRGAKAAADGCTAPILGGNLAAGASISLTTTVVGETGDEVLTRSGAKLGDWVYVTGTLGAASIGLHLLLQADNFLDESRIDEQQLPFVRRWRRPAARIAEGKAIAPVATSAIDLSDGLLQDAGHICEASGVGMELHLQAFPKEPSHTKVAKQAKLDPTKVLLAGGEEYELLFTAPPNAALPIPATSIGHVISQKSVRVVDPQGQALVTNEKGYTHWN